MNELNTTEGKVYGYARVSTEQQSLELQVNALKNAGVPEENIYSEKLSGRSFENRQQINDLVAKLEKGDTLCVHKLDRLGRSVSQVTSLVDKLVEEGKFLVVLDAGIDTRLNEGMAGMMTKALITLLGLMAEMERAFIEERTQAGIKKARENGVKFGAKRKKTKEYDMAVDKYLTGDYTVPQVLTMFTDLSEATFYRRLREAKKKLQEN
ncbi:recombinase family protein [Bacillus paramobilis]|uniref:recombinase family protein n=1 Tax=Bacillus paramobilis TaxID=2817477 RepID=UPI001BB3A772|nr:recombinase family protein [Bacillus paramobilis]HEF5065768.1 recombinase family protein [Bacillus cereus]HEF5237752.1 recombinase family protein [Bacillus cereus]